MVEAASSSPAQSDGGEKTSQRKTRGFISSDESVGNRNHSLSDGRDVSKLF